MAEPFEDVITFEQTDFYKFSRRWKDFGRVKASKPSFDSVHPRPESFTPVHASAGSRMSQTFMHHVPVSIRSPMHSAASRSVVQIEAVNPYWLSFISLIASSSSFTDIMPATGANVSSVITSIE